MDQEDFDRLVAELEANPNQTLESALKRIGRDPFVLDGYGRKDSDLEGEVLLTEASDWLEDIGLYYDGDLEEWVEI